MSKSQMFEGYYSKKELSERGWTIKMFKDHLPKPHKCVPNPFNPNWGQMNLYEVKVVEAIEADPKFQQYKKWTDEKFRPIMREVAKKRAHNNPCSRHNENKM